MNMKIEFSMDNASFEDAPVTEIERIFRDIADHVANGEFTYTIRDTNGNKIGHWAVKQD